MMMMMKAHACVISTYNVMIIYDFKRYVRKNDEPIVALVINNSI